MEKFTVKQIHQANIAQELDKIGFDKSYAQKATKKFEYINLKIFDLSPAQANILKQTALSCGTDCATNKNVITGNIEKSNCILTGSIAQMNKIAEKLKLQPFGLKDLALKIVIQCEKYNNSTKIVGILNVTENSFSDGGLYNNFENAKNHLLQMIDEGADIIDIGAESTKPYSSPIDAKTQLKKILPLIDFAKNKIPLSIDTRSSEVAEECLKAGAKMINDVSGFDYDENMHKIVAKYNCPVIIQHSKGTPENMQDSPNYEDVVEEIFCELHEKCRFAKSKGIENIIIDPGIGFGKTRENNFELIRRIEEFKSLRYPVMLGISRKSFLNLNTIEEKDIYTTVFNSLAIERKVDYIRVHNVKLHKTLIDLMKMFMIE